MVRLLTSIIPGYPMPGSRFRVRPLQQLGRVLPPHVQHAGGQSSHSCMWVRLIKDEQAWQQGALKNVNSLACR